MFQWQFLITYTYSVSPKFQTCYTTGQWGKFTVKIRILLSVSKFLFWQSIKFLQENINHSSETGNITVSVTVWMSYFRKKSPWNFWMKYGNSRGSQEKELIMKFPWVLDIGIGISKGCYTSFGNSRDEASFCLEFLGVK